MSYKYHALIVMEDYGIKIRKNVRFCFFSWFFKNHEFIKDSSLWHSNFILSVCDSVIIIALLIPLVCVTFINIRSGPLSKSEF